MTALDFNEIKKLPSGSIVARVDCFGNPVYFIDKPIYYVIERCYKEQIYLVALSLYNEALMPEPGLRAFNARFINPMTKWGMYLKPVKELPKDTKKPYQMNDKVLISLLFK